MEDKRRNSYDEGLHSLLLELRDKQQGPAKYSEIKVRDRFKLLSYMCAANPEYIASYEEPRLLSLVHAVFLNFMAEAKYNVPDNTDLVGKLTATLARPTDLANNYFEEEVNEKFKSIDREVEEVNAHIKKILNKK